MQCKIPFPKNSTTFPELKEENLLYKVAEIGISYKPIIKPSERLKITCSAEAEKVFRSIWNLPIELRESFYALFLNRDNRVLGYFLVSVGGITGTVVDSRCIFQAALKASAVGILLAHNHPSGNPTPSDADKMITKQLKEAGKLLDIKLLDHLILMPEGYCSMSDEGLI